MRKDRTSGFIYTIFFYLAAMMVGIIVFRKVPMGFATRILVADVAATGLVFLISLLIRNASVYDPYWSVAPIIILSFSMLYFDALTAGNLFLLAVIGYWGVRLTANWAYTFKGYAWQDWRYDMFQEKPAGFSP